MLVLLGCLLTSAPALAKKPPAPSPQEQALAAVDQAMAGAIAQARAQAEANPGDARYVYAWAGGLQGAGQAGSLGRGAIGGLDAFFAAVEGVSADKALGGQISGAAAEVALYAGRTEQARTLS